MPLPTRQVMVEPLMRAEGSHRVPPTRTANAVGSDPRSLPDTVTVTLPLAGPCAGYTDATRGDRAQSRPVVPGAHTQVPSSWRQLRAHRLQGRSHRAPQCGSDTEAPRAHTHPRLGTHAPWPEHATSSEQAKRCTRATFVRPEDSHWHRTAPATTEVVHVSGSHCAVALLQATQA